MNTYFNKKHALFLSLYFFVMLLSAQSQQNYWVKTGNVSNKQQKIKRSIKPDTFQLYQLNLEQFKLELESVSLQKARTQSRSVVMQFPMPNGKMQRFAVVESSIMATGLADKFPMLKTYKAVGLDDKTATMRFSITQQGLHVFSLSGKRSSVFIEPYTVNGTTYIVYNRQALGQPLQDFKCLTEDKIQLKSLEHRYASTLQYKSDQILRTFRLALSCNAKYGALFAGQGTDMEKKANIMAQMLITINRVNEIYERDLAIRLVFIDRNDELIYYDEENDPWDKEFNNKTQEVISTTLQDESLYDIGHNFNTDNGGQAGCIGCVCVDAQAPYTADSKGRGFTGLKNPTGDAFNIDYVAHEMGHQFGAYHTMNTCARSGNGMTEVEPSSGSSIMGYAGICGDYNVQENSDAHFNYVNIRDINNNIQPQGNSSCGAQTPLDNVPPVANAGADYVIPVSTPYVLRGIATDVDGTGTLTYNWSQNDPERAPDEGAPRSTWKVGPLYRSILPTESPNRYMPQLEDVINGNLTPKWEVTPSVARTMNFAFTVRDNGSGFPIGIGQTDADFMNVTVIDGTPFQVNKPKQSKIWYVGNSYDVEWVVGETNLAPINCKKVNIKLSLDGGFTYPITLASNVDNDGLEPVVIPDNPSAACRIMVEAADNIFYDISDTNFSIVKSGPIFVLEQEDEDVIYEACTGNIAFEIPIAYTTVSGFSENTTFSVSDLPERVTGTFSPPSLSKDGVTILTLDLSNVDDFGEQMFTINGVSESLSKSIQQHIVIFPDQINTPQLLTPTDAQKGIGSEINLTWQASDYANHYFVEVSTSDNFSSDVSAYTVQGTQLRLTDLKASKTYFWRVNAINSCAQSNEANGFSFQTLDCFRCISNGDEESVFQTSTTRVIFNTLDNESGKSAYSDFTSVSTNINRGETYSLSIQANTAGNYVTTSTVWIDWNYDCMFDENEMYDLGTAENVVNGITSNSPLEVTVPEDAALSDDIVMRVSTKYSDKASACEVGFDGEVEDYKLQISPRLGVEDHQIVNLNVWPNPNRGSFNVAFVPNSKQPIQILVYDISGRQVFSKLYKSTYTFSENIALSEIASGIYLLKIKEGKRSSVKKIIIE